MEKIKRSIDDSIDEEKTVEQVLAKTNLFTREILRENVFIDLKDSFDLNLGAQTIVGDMLDARIQTGRISNKKSHSKI